MLRGLVLANVLIGAGLRWIHQRSVFRRPVRRSPSGFFHREDLPCLLRNCALRKWPGSFRSLIPQRGAGLDHGMDARWAPALLAACGAVGRRWLGL